MNRKIVAKWTTEKRLRHGKVMRVALALRKTRIKEYDQQPETLLRYIPASTKPARKPHPVTSEKTRAALRAAWTPEKKRMQSINTSKFWRRKHLAGFSLGYPLRTVAR